MDTHTRLNVARRIARLKIWIPMTLMNKRKKQGEFTILTKLSIIRFLIKKLF